MWGLDYSKCIEDDSLYTFLIYNRDLDPSTDDWVLVAYPVVPKDGVRVRKEFQLVPSSDGEYFDLIDISTVETDSSKDLNCLYYKCGGYLYLLHNSPKIKLHDECLYENSSFELNSEAYWESFVEVSEEPCTAETFPATLADLFKTGVYCNEEDIQNYSKFYLLLVRKDGTASWYKYDPSCKLTNSYFQKIDFDLKDFVLTDFNDDLVPFAEAYFVPKLFPPEASSQNVMLNIEVSMHTCRSESPVMIIYRVTTTQEYTIPNKPVSIYTVELENTLNADDFLLLTDYGVFGVVSGLSDNNADCGDYADYTITFATTSCNWTRDIDSHNNAKYVALDSLAVITLGEQYILGSTQCDKFYCSVNCYHYNYTNGSPHFIVDGQYGEWTIRSNSPNDYKNLYYRLEDLLQ